MKSLLGSLIIASTLLGAASGCVVRAHGRVAVPPPVAVVEVEEEPPPPRTVVVETRPGFVFIEGRWHRRGGRWDWVDGHWERERSGHYWTPGRWERRHNRHVWVEGRWQAGGPVIRDHRSAPPAAPPSPPPPIVRDHR